MITIYTYKLQGNGSDSWHVDVHDCQNKNEVSSLNRVTRDLVFEDPSIPKLVDISNIDLTSLNIDQINTLKKILGL